MQRTVLARELSGDVRLLIAQNPCLGLDFAATREIRERILEARNRGAAVLLLSEDLDELLELADRIVVMLDGAWCIRRRARRLAPRSSAAYDRKEGDMSSGTKNSRSRVIRNARVLVAGATRVDARWIF